MEFRGKYWFLSNMYPCAVTISCPDGKIRTFKCAESAYQACKCNLDIDKFVNLDGFAAKKLGHQLKMNPAWFQMRVGYMSGIVSAKFMRNPDLAEQLCALEGHIQEDNTWGDTFWGVCNGVGENRLGKCLMSTRALLRHTLKPRFYTGVGSRETPAEILQLMTSIALKLDRDGWTLRTGDADGADAAFRDGAYYKEVYSANDMYNVSKEVYAKARTDFLELHPKPAACKTQFIQHLHMRNGLELLGETYDKPSKFVLCWTPNARVIGGTGQTIRLANKYKITVCNLADPEQYAQITKWLAK